MSKWLWCLVLVWVASFFALLGWWPGASYNAQRYFEWLLLGCLLMAGACLPVRVCFQRHLVLLLGGLGAFVALVTLLAANGWLAVRYAHEYVAMFLTAMAIAKARVYAGAAVFDRAAMLGVVLLCLGGSIIVFEGFLLSLWINDMRPENIFGAFVNVRMLAELQFATLFLLPAAWSLAKTHRMRCLVTVTAALWWGWLLFSGARATLVVVPWVLLVVFLCAGRRSFPWTQRLLMQLFTGLFLFAVLRMVLWIRQAPVDTVMTYARASGSGRFSLWEEAWQSVLQHPWLGNGPGAFSCLTSRVEASPHNILLLLLSEWGLICVLLVAAVALCAFVAMVRHLREAMDVKALHLSLFASVVAIVTSAQLSGTLIAPLGQMAVVLVLGWAWGAFSPQGFVMLTALEQRRPAGLRLLRWPVVVLLLLSWLAVARADLVMQKELLVVPEDAVAWKYGPRYWLYGHDYCPDWRERYAKEHRLSQL